MTIPFKHLPVYLALLPVFQGIAIAAEPVEFETFTILGRGQTRQVQELGRDDLAAIAPGSSPFKALEKLPGVNFQSADSLGASEWTTKLTIRGFNQNQLGFTLDDVPLGDMSYRNHNGLHVSRAIATENIGRVVLSQGAGALETASTSNLGGTVQFYSLDPAAERRFTAEQSVGSQSARRTYLRADSGRFDNGVRVAVSYVDQSADKWKGGGEQTQQQFNSKLVGEFGDHRLSAFLNYSSRKEVDYQDLSKEMIGRLGYRWDNYYPNWNAALQSAGNNWRRGETSQDDAYYAGSGLRKDWLAGATLNSILSDQATLKTTVYHHRDKGPSLWWTPYQASSAAVPVSLRTVEYGINRNGILSALTVDAGIHTLNTGLWFERNVFDQAMRFYSQANGPSSLLSVPTDPMLTRWDYQFTTNTAQFHLKDRLKLSSQLTADIGFKALSSEISAATRSGADKSGSIKASNGFLPQAGVNFKLDPRHEVFAAVAKNLRAYKGSAMEDSPFATTAAGFTAIKDKLKPETSVTYELGWRYQNSGTEASVTAYHVEFKDRLLGIQQGAAIIGNPSVLTNVGRVDTNGLEAAVSWSPARHVRWFNSFSYNDSRYKNDFTDNGVLIAVNGKQVVDSPKVLVTSRLSYDDGSYFGRIGANHVGKRYYTYLNDNGVDSYTLWDLSVGYRQKASGWLSQYHVQLGVNNLFDKKYVSSLGTNGFVTSDPNGTAQTLQVGAPRAAYLTVGASF